MTRKRRSSIASSARRRRNEVGKVSHLETNYSDPEFAKLHFDQAEVYPLVQTSGFTLLSRLLYLVQPEHDGFERKPETLYGLPEIEHELETRLDAKLKLPLRNFQMINLDSEVETSNRLKLDMKNHKYRIVNSCNGLLCLSDPSDNDPVIVCNPVTGEFINLPEVRTARHPAMPEIACGLGFSPVTRQYKVIRMFKLGAEVNTMGTNSWKDLQSFPWYAAILDKLFTTYLNGCVYWYSPGPHGVICFDVERECFESISPPPVQRHSRAVRACMGALGGELFITEADGLCDPVCLWVLRDRGTKRAWSKIYTFNVSDEDRWPYGSYQPIKYMNDGSLVIFHPHKCALICKHPMEDGFRYWKVRGLESKVEVIAHVPSLISLKHALSENNVEVHSIGSRCGELKLHKETKNIYLVKEDRNSEIDTEDDEEFDEDRDM